MQPLKFDERIWADYLVAVLSVIGLVSAGCRSQSATESKGREPPKHLNSSLWDLSEPVDERPAHRRMLEELRKIRDETAFTIDWLGDVQAKRLREKIAQLPHTAPVAERFTVQKELAQRELRLGNEQQAIGLLLDCEDLLNEQDAFSAEQQKSLAIDLKFDLGVAFLRLAESQNCCSTNTPDSCIVPIQGQGIHLNSHGSSEAIKQFEFVLEHAPERSGPWLRALWLYNLAHMTLDRFPDEVPRQWRLPASTFESEASAVAFRNVAQAKGLDTFSLSGGAIADDFDGDGDLDLVVSTYDTGGQLHFYANDGRGGFTDRTEEAGLTGLLGGLNLIQADYNNDGYLDILVLRGGWFQTAGRHPNSLLRNNGDATFTDVTYAAGMMIAAPTQTASWADYDNDGDLDLYVGNETNAAVPIASQLYRNNGNGTFEDAALNAGVGNQRFAKAVVWGDFNDDNWPDLFVSNLGEENRLYQNRGDGTFEDVARQLGVTRPLRSFPAWFWDYNNDGILDLFVSGYADDVAYLAAESLRMAHDAPLPALFEGNARGGFVNVASQRGLTLPTAPMGSNFGDLDNDGFLDFYLGTGEPEYQNLMPNALYRNQQGEGFIDVTMDARMGHLQKGHAVVFADLDHDGDQDVFEQLGGAYPGDRYYDALFENPGNDHHWLAIELIGVQANRSAIGARVRVEIKQEEGSREIYRFVNSGGSFGANPLRVWIGTGNATRIDSVEIRWPTAGGLTEEIRDIATGQTIRVIQGRARAFTTWKSR